MAGGHWNPLHIFFVSWVRADIRILFMTCLKQVIFQAMIPIREIKIVLYRVIGFAFPLLLRSGILSKNGLGCMVEIGIGLCPSAQGGFRWICIMDCIGGYLVN